MPVVFDLDPLHRLATCPLPPSSHIPKKNSTPGLGADGEEPFICLVQRRAQVPLVETLLAIWELGRIHC